LEAADKTVVNFFDCVKQVKDFAQTHSKCNRCRHLPRACCPACAEP
jgi:uncharacterized OB-fold protein